MLRTSSPDRTTPGHSSRARAPPLSNVASSIGLWRLQVSAAPGDPYAEHDGVQVLAAKDYQQSHCQVTKLTHAAEYIEEQAAGCLDQLVVQELQHTLCEWGQRSRWADPQLRKREKNSSLGQVGGVLIVRQEKNFKPCFCWLGSL